ncbi:RNA polymerase sigma factor [Modestobacter sp. L9-4]|uniref:RNA polymerase sigma factor n=1 Tax=Modestobacter sp. L9-4 TaxID=2851567 RepID=UPI001C74ED25|nr:RNA polymerase sigma factor [Modestobacter sp. L9-4]QXG76179.1 RNA polymerase sigma factor [Modestobacter sp. L9-4]
MTTSLLPTPHRAPADLSDAALVHAAQQGDTQAFAVLVQQHAASLRAVAIATLGYVDEVDDAVQDALLVALRKLPQLRDPDAAGPWLRSIVRTSCLMLVRTRRATPVAEPELLLPADPALGPAAVLERAATGDWVQQAVSELAEPVREVVVLRYFSDWSSYQQIAQLCGVPVDTVRSRLRDGRRALTGALQRSASAAHPDAGRAAEASRSQAEETIAASLSDHYEQVLRERYHPDATVVLPGRQPGDRDSLLAARDHTQGAGVGLRLRHAAASRGLMVWETDFLNPSDAPDHCPPAMAWLHSVRDGRTTRLRLAYREPQAG